MHRTLTRPTQNQSYRRIILLGLVVVVVIGAGALSLILPAAAESEEMTTFSLGAKIEYPVRYAPANIAVETPERIWFTAPQANVIGNLQVNSAPGSAIVTYTIAYHFLAQNSEPIDLVYAANTIWFTERAGNRIGRIDVITGALQEYTVPTPNSGPTGIDVASDGTIWFTEETGMKLAQFDPATESFEEYPFTENLFNIPDPSARDVAIQGNDTVWFTVPNANTVVAFEVDNHKFFSARTGNASMPSHVVIDDDDLPWVTSFGAGLLGRFAPGTLALWVWYKTAASDSGPAGIAFTANGSILDLWFAEYNRGRVGHMKVGPNGQFLGLAEYPLFSDSKPWGIAIDAHSHIWVAENGRNTITQLRPPYAYYAHLPFLGRQE